MSTYEATIKIGNNSQYDNTDTGTNEQSSESQQAAQPSSLKQTLGTIKKAVAATGALMITQKAVNYVTSRVYTETGNRQWQDSINAAKQVGGQIATIAGGFLMGGVAGGLVAIAGVGMDYLMQLASYNFAKNLESQILTISRERMGVGGFNINQSRSVTQ